MWESDPQIAREEERETNKQTKMLCFPDSSHLSFTGTKEIFVLALERISQIFPDLNPLGIARVRFEFQGLAAC